MPWAEDAPAHCPRGRELGPDRVLVGWRALTARARRMAHADRNRRIIEALEGGEFTRRVAERHGLTPQHVNAIRRRGY